MIILIRIVYHQNQVTVASNLRSEASFVGDVQAESLEGKLIACCSESKRNFLPNLPQGYFLS